MRDPQLLVFDEASIITKSLTGRKEISRTVRDVAANQEAITILIAHRLSTVMLAQTASMCWSAGRIVRESGRHSELLAQEVLYYAM